MVVKLGKRSSNNRIREPYNQVGGNRCMVVQFSGSLVSQCDLLLWDFGSLLAVGLVAVAYV